MTPMAEATSAPNSGAQGKPMPHVVASLAMVKPLIPANAIWAKEI